MKFKQFWLVIAINKTRLLFYILFLLNLKIIHCSSIKNYIHVWNVITIYLLVYIDNHWLVVSRRLKTKSLKTTVAQFKDVSADTLKGKKKDETIVKANKICQVCEILDVVNFNESNNMYFMDINR